jgi:serine phosphatase RsbU (regulator of sigma subunit)
MTVPRAHDTRVPPNYGVRMTMSPQRIPPRVIDVVLALVVAVATSIAIAVAPYFTGRRPDALAYGLAGAIGALMLVRRRFPALVLLATIVLIQIYYSIGYPGFFPGIPIAAALYTAAVTGRLRWAVIVVAFYVIGPLIWRTFVEPDSPLQVVNSALRDGGFLVAVILLGAAVRNRRAYVGEVADRLRRAEAERERISQELTVAHLVQQEFLPHELPELPGWKIGAFYRSAREVGGDFYDVVSLSDGRVAITIGDVTDKGAPAALLMATTQGLLRAGASPAESPAELLARVNNVLVPNVPSKMFVTCLYLVLDTIAGRVLFANAGHPLPYMATEEGVTELRATGMPLGLLPGMSYEQNEAEVPPGGRVLLHTDGLAEAHNDDRDMFGLPRIIKVVENSPPSDDLVGTLLAELERFTGPEREQEDDITLVTLERSRS